MNFRLIALASCVALGSIALGGKAQAQTAPAIVPFSGAFANTCTFSAPIGGRLARPGSFVAVESTAGIPSLGSTGTGGSVTVNCTGNLATVSVAPPATVSVPGTFVPPVRQSIVQRGSNAGIANFTTATSGARFNTALWTTLSSTAPLAVPAGLSTLNVGMVAGEQVTGVLPTGTYTYSVTLTATPN